MYNEVLCFAYKSDKIEIHRTRLVKGSAPFSFGMSYFLMVKVKKKRFSKVFNLCKSWIKLNVRQCYFLH